MDDSTPLMVTLSQPEYDVSTCEDLARELMPSYTAPKAIVDMSAVRYLDSTCLSKLVRMHSQRLNRGFAPARLVLPSKQLRHIFEIVHFDGLWPLYQSLELALKDPWSEPPEEVRATG
jgi:anti-anti-sigma factor